MNEKKAVIGIDGGGTHTRVLVCDTDGNALAYVERGSASFHKDERAAQNVREAIREALSQAGCAAGQAIGLAAGIAGYDQPSDLDWIRPSTELPGLACPKWHVNDAVSAHAGALLGEPGIVVIAGTGSIIVGVTLDGEVVRNYDFHHYAASAARFLAYDAVYETLAGNADESDAELVQSMLGHWNVRSLSELGDVAKRGFHPDRRERDKHFGDFAPILTRAAEQGSSTARRVCDRAILQTKVGIELIAPSLGGGDIPVAFIGSVANSPYFYRTLRAQLDKSGNNGRFAVAEPAFPPVVGSVLLAMKHLGLPIGEAFLDNIRNGADYSA
ncbi:BadF/BadG/BcrA/BcrD ATPase family protein [Paenibacillus arenilitoris]|uniref:ATPase n=1 Tax=Paenibacillus arenilitoris TaxID=2772299 RepID=A0A927CMZ2_9BACL|nr:BadF/BadG/BcrA/BcrD ATPase family protein [Paenibacillus arenilitoris]MBD2870252.1 ATPase [Paenibacillus arenilitoris]